MNWKNEYKIFLWILGFFLFAYFMPIENEFFSAAIIAAFDLAKWYAQEHVLLCLIPAFFNGLNRLGLTTFEPRGAFYAFPQIRASGMNDETFAETLLREEHVAVVPGNAFGKGGEGFVRCCYATCYEQIEEALRRMEKFMERHG